MSHVPTEPELLRSLLKIADITCPSCRYNLHQCESNRCPECGVQLQLGVVVPGLAPALWAAAVFGLAITTILNGYLLLASSGNVVRVLMNTKLDDMVRAGFTSTSELPDWFMMFTMTILLLIWGGTLAWVAVSRRRFNLLTTKRQVLIGLTGLASPLLLLGAIAFLTWLL